MSAEPSGTLEAWIERWREYVLASGANQADVIAAEQTLRDNSAALVASGLDAEEAFLVALKRIVATSEPSREFARDYSATLWTTPAGVERAARGARTEFWVMLACAVAAATAIKLPALFGFSFEGPNTGFYLRNMSLFVLPFLALYFTWKRGVSRNAVVGLAAAFLAAVAFANAFPFESEGSTLILTAIHLPIALWLAVGVAHAGGRWKSDERRMDFVRFTGEWLVTYALIALGGGVLIALTMGVFESIGLDVGSLIEEWVVPCGAMGAVLVAAWLAETRRDLVGGMAPMLARVFTPLFAVMLVALLLGVISTRGVIDVEREVLILFDLLLVLVLALLLYAFSARDPLARPGFFDRLQLLLVGCALAVDAFALLNIAARLTEFGFSANRTAALGLNLILLANLGWSAVLQTGFLRSLRGFELVERWQMRYLLVYAAWAVFVVVAFPLLFSFG